MKIIRENVKLDPKEFWWIDKLYNPRQEHAYLVGPVCEAAEYRYLAFLLFLKKSGIDPKKFISTITIFSHDKSKHTQSKTIQKQPMINYENGVYKFGENTRLVLDGTLAGTVAQASTEDTSEDMSGIACRPLFEHSMTELIEDFIKFYTNYSINYEYDQTNSRSDKYKDFVNLLKCCLELIENLGYIPALISTLADLNIPADFKHIEENARIVQTYNLPSTN